MTEMLFTSLTAGFLGSAITVIYTGLIERHRRRLELMSAVVRWVNEAYSLIQFLHGRKDACYRGKKIDRREYRVQSRALRDLLLSNDALKAQVAILYGEGRVMQMMNALNGHMLAAAQSLWTARSTNWSTVGPALMASFADTIDPLRSSFERELLRATRSAWRPY
jgi:hypothetical protein